MDHGQFFYGAGLRVAERVRFRVKDVDFGCKQVVARDGKGRKDRVAMLPEVVIEALARHLEKVNAGHDIDLKAVR